MTNSQTPSSDIALAKEVAHLSRVIQRQNVWHYRLLLGIVQGVGTVIGATVVAGVLLYVLGGIAKQIPWGDVATQAITRAMTTR